MGRNYNDILGQKFSCLIVVKKTAWRKNNHIVWLCRCDCGSEVLVRSDCLHTGHTKSCGCAQVVGVIKHGHTRYHELPTKEYQTWAGIIQRCLNPNHKRYKDWGGRGIRVCNDWLKFENFLAYLKANNMYPKPTGLSIDRIENNGNYEPGNIRWATHSQQQCNQRPRSRKI